MMETVPVWIQEILSPSRFIPHGHCYLWQPQLVWLHVLSDTLIGLSYFSISIMLFYFVQRRENVPFRGVFLLFGLFILTCGTTHLMSVWTLWHPAYWLAGSIKAATAIASVFTALTLLPTIPAALALPQPETLRRINRQLEKEIEERKQAEATLQYQLEFDQVVSEISARFVGISLEDIDDEIMRSLQTIGQFMQVDTSYIFELDTNKATASMRYEWISDSRTAQIDHAQNLPNTDFPWAINQLSKANILKIADVQTLPSTALKEKQNWQAFNVRSLIAVPFISQDKLLGWVGFASFSQTTDWSNNSAQLLRLLAEILTRALQRQESEQALHQSEVRLRMALEAGKTICWEYDFSTECVHGFGEFVDGSWQPNRWQKKSVDCQSDVYKADQAKLYQALKEAMNTSGEFSVEHRLRRKHKDLRPDYLPKQTSSYQLLNKKEAKEIEERLEEDAYYWVLTKGKVLSSEKDAEASRIVALTVDVSKRKQTEAELQKSKDRWQLALRGTNDGIWDADLTTEQVFVSPRLKEMLGYSAKEWGDRVEDWSEKIHPDDIERVIKALHAHRYNATPFYMEEYRILCKCGRYKWVLDRGKALRNKQGVAIRMTGSLSDIADRKQAETELRQLNQQLEARVEERTAEVIESEQRFRSLFESAPDFIYVLDRQGIIQQINPTVIDRSGYLEAELVGQPLFAFLREEPDSIEQGMTELLSTGQHRQEMAFVCRDNSTLVVDCSCTLFGGKDNDDYILVIQRDITERHAIDRMKSEFISVVSHELRTPITSIHGALDLLDSGLIDPNSDRGQHVFGIAVENSDRLVKLVNDILELERLDSDKIRLNYEEISTRALIKRCYELMELTAERAGITLKMTDSDIWMWADGDRLIQVLTNLVGNAIKFSDAPATVWVGVEAEADSVKFTVKDEGRGIPADKLEGIFKRFHQVDASDSRRKGGTGLGLAICRSIVEQHDGCIWAESKLGAGSVFSFTLPAIYKRK